MAPTSQLQEFRNPSYRLKVEPEKIKNCIGGWSGSRARERATTKSLPSRKTDRVDIINAPYWQISRDGSLYYNRQRRAPVGNPPRIDLGPNAHPPVIPAFGDGSRDRFVDELVCAHFHTQIPITQQRHTIVRHFDGDSLNCAADNVYQFAYPYAILHRSRIRAWMASDIPSKRVKMPGAASFAGRRGEKEPRGLRGGDFDDLPAWHTPVPTWTRIDEQQPEGQKL